MWSLFLSIVQKYPAVTQLIKFSIIGTLGLFIDLAGVHISYRWLLLPFRISRALGFIAAFTSNFFLNRRFTFNESKNNNMAIQYLLFFLVAISAFSINWFISVYLFEHVPFFNRYYLFAAFLGSVGGLVINFTGSKFIVFK